MRLTHYILYGMAALLVCSCQGDQASETHPQEGAPAVVTLDLSAYQGSTRATGTPERAEYDCEKIHSWWVAFVSRSDGKVKLIASRPTDMTTYVEEEEVKVEIPTGTYVLYAFANITPDELAESTGLRFTVGNTCPDVQSATLSLPQPWERGKDIPMTGKQEVSVTGRNGEVIAIEVVRALAKMDITFTNESSRPVTLLSLGLSQSATDQVALLPNYTYLRDGMPEATSPVTARDFVRTYAPQPVLARYTQGAAADSYRDVFYVRESQAAYNATGRYLLSVTIAREGGHAQDRLYALTTDLHSIYRNDHVVIPIVLSDYQVSMQAEAYPPIGGYPAVVTQESEEEFACRFGTEGDFVIRPQVLDTQNGYSLLYGSGSPYYTFTLKAVSDPDGILARRPETTASGEIEGRLGTARGTASVDVEITVHQGGASSQVADQLYVRKIYLIRL